MADKNIRSRMQQKHDISSNWALATNFVPLAGEIIVYSDLNKFKIGDGVTLVGELPFATSDIQIDQTYNATSTNPQSGTAVAQALSTVDALPEQSGQNGKFLTTNGTAASWANVDALPSQSGQSGKYLRTNGTAASWEALEALPAVTTSDNDKVLAVVNGAWAKADLQTLIAAWEGGNF